MAYLSYMTGFPGVADVFLRDSPLYAPLLQFIEGVMTRPSELTKAEREMIAAQVSGQNKCGFCLGAHRSTLAAMGVSCRVIDAVETGRRPQDLAPKFRALLDFSAKLTASPDRMTSKDIDTLLRSGWTEQGIEDAINVVALFNYVNRLVDALGIQGDETYFGQIGEALARAGYAPLIETALKRAS